VQEGPGGPPVDLALSVVGAVMTWNRGRAFAPERYPFALIALAMPCAPGRRADSA
jgi:hypothetical protein